MSRASRGCVDRRNLAWGAFVRGVEFWAILSSASALQAAPIQTVVTYKSTVTSDTGGLLDLKAELNYDSARPNAPIAVVMHGYSGSSGKMAEARANAQRLRDAGFFAVSVALRGRDGSDGVRDSGGVEIYDIYDAVEYVKAQFGSLVDETNVHITGYSGGGGNVMSALTRFPDYFRAGSSFFGMSDYGYDTTSGWYFEGAEPGHISQMNTDIGNATLGNPTIEDRYMARASNLASQNNPYSEIHLFVNSNETNCPPVNHQSYRDRAVAAADFAGEFDNIQVHLGGLGQYVDFNGNSINDANELQNWPHGYPNANQQQAAESWYLADLLSGAIPQPVLNTSDELFVAGFVKTQRFSLWLGDGMNAAADLRYDLAGNEWTFDLEVLSNNTGVSTQLSVDTTPFAGRQVDVLLNDGVVQTIVGGGIYHYPFVDFGNGDELKLVRVSITGDANDDGVVDIFDVNTISSHWGSSGPEGDVNGDGQVDIFDVNVVSDHWGEGIGGAASVSEPANLALSATAALVVMLVRTVRRVTLGITLLGSIA